MAMWDVEEIELDLDVDNLFEEGQWIRYMLWYNEWGAGDKPAFNEEEINLDEAPPRPSLDEVPDMQYVPHATYRHRTIARVIRRAMQAVEWVKKKGWRRFGKLALKDCKGHFEDAQQPQKIEELLQHAGLPPEIDDIPDSTNDPEPPMPPSAEPPFTYENVNFPNVVRGLSDNWTWGEMYRQMGGDPAQLQYLGMQSEMPDLAPQSQMPDSYTPAFTMDESQTQYFHTQYDWNYGPGESSNAAADVQEETPDDEEENDDGSEQQEEPRANPQDDDADDFVDFTPLAHRRLLREHRAPNRFTFSSRRPRRRGH